jgi:hypothetical protein
MTMSAQLMAAGANQQLIVEKLQPPPPPAPAAAPEQPKEQAKKPEKKTVMPPPPKPEGMLEVAHGLDKQAVEEVDINPNEIRIDKEGNLKTPEEIATERAAQPQVPPAAAPTLAPPEPPATPQPPTEAVPPMPSQPVDSASASTSPHALLVNQGPVLEAPFSATTSHPSEDNYPIDPLAEETPHEEGFVSHSGGVTPPHLDQARSAVETAYSAAPFDPANQPLQALNAQTLAEVNPPQAAPAPPQMDMTPPAPPPFAPPPSMPPPITTPQGVVIPPPYTPPGNSGTL